MSLSTKQAECLASIASCSTVAELDALKVSLLGKSGLITNELKRLKEMEGDDRRAFGEAVNTLKDTVAQALESQHTTLRKVALQQRLEEEWVDITQPIRPICQGKLHPIHQGIEEILDIFSQMGFVAAEGPDIEDDFHNFTALNVPETHPARQLMDTFYFSHERDGHPLLLRTHTSCVQIRTLSQTKPPLRIVAAGRVFRSDYDQTHTPNFHQVEGIVIEKNIHMGHLKGCLTEFCQRFFGLQTVAMRFRPNYFPFTEPSAEVDIQCCRKDGKITLGEGDDWLEVLGCGMVHPKVLENCGIDSTQHQGFAFGIGVERLAMLKYGITDLRAFYDADMRWLRHHGFGLHEAAPPSPAATLS